MAQRFGTFSSATQPERQREALSAAFAWGLPELRAHSMVAACSQPRRITGSTHIQSSPRACQKPSGVSYPRRINSTSNVGKWIPLVVTPVAILK